MVLLEVAYKQSKTNILYNHFVQSFVLLHFRYKFRVLDLYIGMSQHRFLQTAVSLHCLSM